MSGLLRIIVPCILFSIYSLNIYAGNTLNNLNKKPEFIPVVKKPCYIGCDYLFQFCYYYNISNMEDAITVKEWNVEGDFITGKAVADIKAKLLIKMCYQVSLTSAYPVVDQDLNLETEFEFKIKVNGEGKDQCIDYQEDAIKYSSFELKGDTSKNPVSVMQGQLELDMANIIRDSVSKAAYEYLQGGDNKNKVYCSDEYNKVYEDTYPCRCD